MSHNKFLIALGSQFQLSHKICEKIIIKYFKIKLREHYSRTTEKHPTIKTILEKYSQKENIKKDEN